MDDNLFLREMAYSSLSQNRTILLISQSPQVEMTIHHFSKSGPVTTAESPKLYYAYSNSRIVFDDFSMQDSIKSTMCFKKYPKHKKNKPKSCTVTWGKYFIDIVYILYYN